MKYVTEFIKKKKSLLIFLFFLTTKINLQAQIVDYFKSIENSIDTSSELKYFKTIDKEIKKRLDSFYIIINEKKKLTDNGMSYCNTDSGYITIDFYRDKKSKKLNIFFRLNNSYIDYLIATSKDENYDNLFGFTLYKSKVVLMNLRYSKFRIKNDFLTLMKDFIIPELTQTVKKEVTDNVNSYEINTSGRVYKKYRSRHLATPFLVG